MVAYKLYYFDARGFAEATRQMFHIAGQKFEDIRLNRETEWPQAKEKMPFGKVPVLEVDGEQIAESHSIARFVAKRLGFYGKSDIEQAHIDSLADQYKDYFGEFREFFMNVFQIVPTTPEKIESLKQTAVIPARDRFFGALTKFLKKSKTGFLAGGDVSFADLWIADHVDSILAVFPAYVDNFPEVKAHLAKVHAIPELNKWLEVRPKNIY